MCHYNNGFRSDSDPLSFSASGLPPGLNIATATGLISGTVDTVGVYLVTVTVIDGTDNVSVTLVGMLRQGRIKRR